ncbi:hypothetical protein CsatB_019478 [Cannabis sativa]
MGVGFMAVFAVTGSVVLLAHQIHKRVLSDFMKDIEFELGLPKRRFGIGGSCMKRSSSNKTVRFAEDVVEPSSNNEEYRKKKMEKQPHHPPNMPLNRQVLYRGIIDYKLGHKN